MVGHNTANYPRGKSQSVYDRFRRWCKDGTIVEAAAGGVEPYRQLPKPFKAIIPNAAAIAEASEPNRSPRSFTTKYTPQFARLYRSLCEDIVQRSQWQRAGADRAAVPLMI